MWLPISGTHVTDVTPVFMTNRLWHDPDGMSMRIGGLRSIGTSISSSM